MATLIAPAHAPVHAIATLDVPRYMGQWYEIAKFPNRFQKKCVAETVAQYTLLTSGRVRVTNRCRMANGEMDEAIGMARQMGAKNSPKLKVRFAPEWLSFLDAVWGDYWVLDPSDATGKKVIRDKSRSAVVGRKPRRSSIQPQFSSFSVVAAEPVGPLAAVPRTSTEELCTTVSRLLDSDQQLRAIVMGPSGSGNSTLAKALLGLWPRELCSGKILCDGLSVWDWDRQHLGASIGYLPQDIALLDGNLADNIARHGRVNDAAVVEAAQQVGIHEMILRLPNGYETAAGEAGQFLSGGQRQLMGLARAIYGKPRWVVLDEPNSSLDEAGDIALANAIASLKQLGTTFVVMTHRTSVLGVADKMLIMRDGAQQAFGPRDEVLATLQQKAKA
jgi:ABC-type cobalamin/Fe3+-siderophores transport system ATPase subunit/lipocalin